MIERIADGMISSIEELKTIYDPPNSIVLGKVIKSYDKHATTFINHATFVVINVRDASGAMVPVIAGGSRGFAKVTGPNALSVEIPLGNWPRDQLSEPGESGYHAGFLFIVPGVKETLRMKGSLAIAPAGSGRTLLAELHLDEAFFHCAKALIRSRIWDKPQPMTRWSGLREFRCVEKIAESAVITSFRFVPVDGKELPDFRPGQYVPIEIDIVGQTGRVRRSYSISNRPGESSIRISVKREQPPAVASGYLHDHVRVGDIVRMRSPAGKFVLDETSDRPVVLLSAGVGLTPMVSMVDHLLAVRTSRRIWFFHGAISGREHAMANHLRRQAAEHDNLRLVICYGRPRPEDMPGRDYDHGGRISIDMLKRMLPRDDYEFYVCGPSPFMKDIVEGLFDSGVLPERLHWEAFSSDKPAIRVPARQPGTEETEQNSAVSQPPAGTKVVFERSARTVVWDPACSSLLDLAEVNGINSRSSCRTGECFSCAVKVSSGSVAYVRDLEEEPDDGTVLICSAVPQGPVSLDM